MALGALGRHVFGPSQAPTLLDFQISSRSPYMVLEEGENLRLAFGSDWIFGLDKKEWGRLNSMPLLQKATSCYVAAVQDHMEPAFRGG